MAVRSGVSRLVLIGVAAAALAFSASQISAPGAHAVFEDTDGDGAIDIAEELGPSDPNDPNSVPEGTAAAFLAGMPICSDGVDNDLDGLTDDDDPGCTDSDNDIIADELEELLGSDPNDSASFPEDSRVDVIADFYGFPIFFCGDNFDNDGDGLTDEDDPGCVPFESDSDPFPDPVEKRFGSDPSDPASTPEHDEVNPGSCGDGVDNDQDGMTDAADPACGSPPNDERADATIVPALPYMDGPLVMKNATVETNEPRPSCFFGGGTNTVWYRFTATEEAVLIADSVGSNFDVALTVWRQQGASLREVGCSAFVAGSHVVFDAEAGTTYFFQINGFLTSQALPTLTFNLVEGVPPANDDFLDAVEIDALPFQDSRNLIAAGTEQGEPSGCAFVGQGSSASTVWYRFQPDDDVLVLATVSGSQGQGFAGVYVESVFGLFPVACASPTGSPFGSTAAFQAEAGVEYFVQLGRVPFFGSSSAFDVTLRLEEGIPPENDDFANAQPITSLPFTNTVDSLTATLEANESQPSCLTFERLGQSVWYSYTATSDSIIIADTEGTFDFGSAFGIYQGTSLDDLAEVACTFLTFPYPQYAFEAEAGKTYYFQVGIATFDFVFDAEAQASGGWGDRDHHTRAIAGLPPSGAEPGDLVFNLRGISPPACPEPTFEIDDPAGDTFGFGGAIPEPAPDASASGEPFGEHDILAVRGGSDDETFCLTVDFAAPIEPPDADTERSIAGFVDIDTDENTRTGFGAAVGVFCPDPAGIGADVELSMFGGSGLLIPLFSISGPSIDDAFALAVFDDTSVTLTMPLAAIGGDDRFNFALVFGSLFGPTDCAPNGGAIHSPTGVFLGDVNCNRSPGPVDATLILQYNAGLLQTLPCLEAGDVNGDGLVNATDAALLLQFVAGVIPTLPG